jgi:FkbM family methyltransferase
MDKVIIDIGSNKLGGYRKLVDILGITDEWLKVFIEPNPENYEYLNKEIEFIPNSTLIKKAVNSNGNSVVLTTRNDREGDIAATIFGQKYLDETLKKYGQSVNGYTTYEVEGITIEQILKPYYGKDIYLKIDCEGAEYEILLNFPQKYMPFIKRMFVEFHGGIDNKWITDQFENNGITVEEWE